MCVCVVWSVWCLSQREISDVFVHLLRICGLSKTSPWRSRRLMWLREKLSCVKSEVKRRKVFVSSVRHRRTEADKNGVLMRHFCLILCWCCLINSLQKLQSSMDDAAQKRWFWWYHSCGFCHHFIVGYHNTCIQQQQAEIWQCSSICKSKSSGANDVLRLPVLLFPPTQIESNLLPHIFYLFDNSWLEFRFFPTSASPLFLHTHTHRHYTFLPACRSGML